ncbi:hypothetical protein H0H93_004164 [Arthromyces matolae]|nr:hypothetical protein H0H93_004164 [Arthromyces matolae]
MIIGRISDMEWERFFYYARRVKEFIYPTYADDNRILDHAKLRLAQLWTTPLLPTLKKYTCYDVRSLGPFIHSLFIPSCLESLTLGMVTDAQDLSVGTLLSILADEASPDLRALSISGTLSSSSLSYVLEFQELKSLTLISMGDIIDSYVLTILSEMEKLERLVIDIHNASPSLFTFQVASPLTNGFKTLKTLHVHATHATTELFLTQLGRHVQMEGLGFIFPSSNTPLPVNWESEFESLVSMVIDRWPSSLKKIIIDREWSSFVLLSLPTRIITPFFCLPNMEHFSISEFLISFSDEDIENMANSWPCLKRLCIPYHVHVSPQQLSVDTLYTLAKNCPKLEHLEIPIDIKHVPPLDLSTLEFPDPSHTPALHTLYIANDNHLMGTQDLLLIARHLDRLFPHLRKLGRLRLDNADLGPWDKVFAMIEAFRAVRMDSLIADGRRRNH